MGPNLAIEACELAIHAAIQWNALQHRVPSESTIGNRLLASRDALADSYAELYLALGPGRHLETWFGLVISAASIWADGLEPDTAAEQAELMQVNRRIALAAAELSGLLQRREDLRQTSGLKDQTFYSIADVIDAAGDHDLYRYKLTASIDDLRNRFDWKHWPSLEGVARALAEDAEAAQVPAETFTEEVGRIYAPGTPQRFFDILFKALSNTRNVCEGMFPDRFDVTNETLAALANVALRVDRSDRLTAGMVDGLYGDWTQAHYGQRSSRRPYVHELDIVDTADGPPF